MKNLPPYPLSSSGILVVMVVVALRFRFILFGLSFWQYSEMETLQLSFHSPLQLGRSFLRVIGDDLCLVISRPLWVVSVPSHPTPDVLAGLPIN